MKILTCILFIGLFTAFSSFGADDVKPHSTTPKDGFVPNEQIAIQIAVAVWTPIYGMENIERQKPYKAWLKDGIWHVTGNLPQNTVGGVAIAEIQKSDVLPCVYHHAHGSLSAAFPADLQLALPHL